ncbi:MAG TPA: GtrA family protein [Candidatus Paceibacterota bacterium]|nr:GtrA family protein [Candidatus Paceibacterota bacterium]
MSHHFHSSLWFGLLAGAFIAIFSLIVFGNLGVYAELGLSGATLVIAAVLWCLIVPLGLASGLKILTLLPLPESFTRQFVRYGVIGVLNTLLSLTIFNLLMSATGVTRGYLITVFSVITFVIVISHAFLWNKFLVFRSEELAGAHREYTRFFLVSGTTALVNVVVISLLVNVVGPLWGIAPKLWANIAVLSTVPISVFGNFFGYKFLVFRTHLI